MCTEYIYTVLVRYVMIVDAVHTQVRPSGRGYTNENATPCLHRIWATTLISNISHRLPTLISPPFDRCQNFHGLPIKVRPHLILVRRVHNGSLPGTHHLFIRSLVCATSRFPRSLPSSLPNDLLPLTFAWEYSARVRCGMAACDPYTRQFIHCRRIVAETWGER